MGGRKSSLHTPVTKFGAGGILSGEEGGYRLPLITKRVNGKLIAEVEWAAICNGEGVCWYFHTIIVHHFSDVWLPRMFGNSLIL